MSSCPLSALYVAVLSSPDSHPPSLSLPFCYCLSCQARSHGMRPWPSQQGPCHLQEEETGLHLSASPSLHRIFLGETAGSWGGVVVAGSSYSLPSDRPRSQGGHLPLQTYSEMKRPRAGPPPFPRHGAAASPTKSLNTQGNYKWSV